MITYNTNNNFFNFQFTSTLPNNIIVKDNSIITDWQNNIIWWYSIDFTIYSYKQLEEKLLSFLKINQQNINFTIESNTLPINYKIIVNTILQFDHPQITYKTVKNNISQTYNINFSNTDMEIIDQIIKNEAQNIARDLCDLPPNILTPDYFCNFAINLFKEFKKIEIKVFNEKDIEITKMGLLLGITAGSKNPAKVLVLSLNQNESNYVLIGKGVTFDSGGYCLKSSKGQLGMKNDMAGAAISLGTIFGLAKLNSTIPLTVICGLTENLIDKNSLLISSVLTSYDQQTVEITNTDAEGRLVLADCIAYAKTRFNPKEIITIATLTGAVTITLGKYATAAFTNYDGIFEYFNRSCIIEHEQIWQLPVFSENYDYINDGTTIADMCNAPREEKGASSNAAAFLFNFAKNTPLLHLDIGGTGVINRDRGTGVMVKSLINYFSNK